MQTWTDTTYNLTADPDLPLCVTRHDDGIALHIAGYALDGRGFCVNFTTVQLATVEELAQALRALKDRQEVQAMLPRTHTTHVDLDEEIRARRKGQAIP